MISMKRKATKANVMDPDMTSSGSQYPYGLQIHLGVEELAKLGIDADAVEVGGVLTIAAKVKVTGYSESKHEGEEEHKSLALQITDMEVSMPAKAASKAKGLYD